MSRDFAAAEGKQMRATDHPVFDRMYAALSGPDRVKSPRDLPRNLLKDLRDVAGDDWLSVVDTGGRGHIFRVGSDLSVEVDV